MITLSSDSIGFLTAMLIGYALAMNGCNIRSKGLAGFGVGMMLGSVFFYLCWILS